MEDDVFGECVEIEDTKYDFNADYRELREIGDCTKPRQYRAALKRRDRLWEATLAVDLYSGDHYLYKNDEDHVLMLINEYEEANPDTYLYEMGKVFRD